MMNTSYGALHGGQGWSAGQGSQQMLILELSHPQQVGQTAS